MPIGLLYTHHIEISESSQMLKGRLQFFQELLHFDLMDRSLNDFLQKSSYTTSNTLHHEKILAAIQREHYYQPLNSAIDLTRFFMMEYKMPITFHDATKIKFPLSIKEQAVFDQKGKVASPDDVAIHTQAQSSTSEGLHIFFFPSSFTQKNAIELLQAAGKMFVHVHGGEFETKYHH